MLECLGCVLPTLCRGHDHALQGVHPSGAPPGAVWYQGGAGVPSLALSKELPPPLPPFKDPETLQVFAPLARLLGLYSIKEELEALSFMYSDPEGYAVVQRRLDVLAKMQGDVVLAVRPPLHCMACLGRDGSCSRDCIPAKITLSAPAHPSSAWHVWIEGSCSGNCRPAEKHPFRPVLACSGERGAPVMMRASHGQLIPSFRCHVRGGSPVPEGGLTAVSHGMAV